MLYVTIPHYHHQQPDYFTVRPPIHNDGHFSIETPLASPDCRSTDTSTPATPLPSNPLLASRDPPSATHSPTTSTPTLLQMQTNASHSTHRPDPSPVQNVLHTTPGKASNSASSSSSSSGSAPRGSSLEMARCSRCQRTPSVDAKTGRNNMVEYGLNLWYCTRCAQMVGLGRG